MKIGYFGKRAKMGISWKMGYMGKRAKMGILGKRWKTGKWEDPKNGLFWGIPRKGQKWGILGSPPKMVILAIAVCDFPHTPYIDKDIL